MYERLNRKEDKKRGIQKKKNDRARNKREKDTMNNYIDLVA